METEKKSKKKPVEKTQKYRLLDWFTDGKKTTVKLAARQLRIGSLPRRVKDLKAFGFAVKDQWISYPDLEGETIHVKEWFMEQDQIEKKMELLRLLKERLTLHASPSHMPSE